MDIRYEHYNALTFEAYAKASIDNGIRKEVRQRTKQRSMELPLSELTDPMQYRVCHEDLTAEAAERQAAIFTVLDESIVVRDAQLAQALTYLLPHARDILLLTYFEDMSLSKMARAIGISKSAAHRQLNAALTRLRELLRTLE